MIVEISMAILFGDFVVFQWVGWCYPWKQKPTWRRRSPHHSIIFPLHCQVLLPEASTMLLFSKVRWIIELNFHHLYHCPGYPWLSLSYRRVHHDTSPRSLGGHVTHVYFFPPFSGRVSLSVTTHRTWAFWWKYPLVKSGNGNTWIYLDLGTLWWTNIAMENGHL